MDKKEAFIQEQPGLKKPAAREGLGNILKTVVRIGGAALAILGAKEAQAGSPPPVPPGVPFPEEVNGLGDQYNSVGDAQLNKGAQLNHFNMPVYVKGGAGYTFEYEVVDDGNNGLILKQTGEPKKDLVTFTYDNMILGAPYIEFPRPDGKTDVFDSYTGALNGVYHFNPAYCTGGGYATFTSPSVTAPREIKLLGSHNIYPFASWDYNAWRVNIDEVDYCLAIQEDLEAAQAAGFVDAWEAGLLVYKESYAGEEELTAPETEEMIAVTRSGDGISFYTRDPDDPMKLTSLKRVKSEAASPLTPNPAGTIDYNDIPDAKAHAMLRVNTKPDGGGEDVNLLVFFADDGLRVAGYKKQPDGTYNHVPVSFDKDLTAIVDSDGDGIEDSVEATSGKCQWRADPSPTDDPTGMVDELGPEGIPDWKSDACAADCEEAGWPGKNAPAGKGEADFWECDTSDLGYAHAFTRGDGSTLHSNMELETGTDEAGQHVNLKPGQEAYWYHSKTPWGSGAASPDFKIPDGNSVSVKILAAKKPDGSPAKVTLKYTPFEDGILGEPVEVTFDNPTEWMDFPVQVGGVLGSDGTAMIVKVGEENIVVPCPPVCTPEPVPEPGPEPGPEADPELMPTAEPVAEPASEPGPEPTPEPSPEPGAELCEDAGAEEAAEEGTVAVVEMPNIVESPLVVAELPPVDAGSTAPDAGSAEPDTFAASDTPAQPDTPPVQPDTPVVPPIDSGVDADSGSAEHAADTAAQEDMPPQQGDIGQDTAPGGTDTIPAGEETGTDVLPETGTQPGTEAGTNTGEEDNADGNGESGNNGGGGDSSGCEFGGAGAREKAPIKPENLIPFVPMAVVAALKRIRRKV